MTDPNRTFDSEHPIVIAVCRVSSRKPTFHHRLTTAVVLNAIEEAGFQIVPAAVPKPDPAPVSQERVDETLAELVYMGDLEVEIGADGESRYKFTEQGRSRASAVVKYLITETTSA